MQGVWAWVMTMWRSGVAIALVLGLAVLVSKLWLDDSAFVRSNWRTATTAIFSADEQTLLSASDSPAGGTSEPAASPDEAQEPQEESAADIRAGASPSGQVNDPLAGDILMPLAPVHSPEQTADAVATAEASAEIPPSAAPSEGRPSDRTFPPGEPRPATVPPHGDLALPPPRPAHLPPTTKMITEVQHRLMALGYDLGGADGRMGYRTEAAVRDFQKSIGVRPDGRIDDLLLAHLDTAVRARAQARQRQAPVPPPASAAAPAEPKRGMLGAVLGGFQRLIGQDLDGLRRPAELAAYCRSNADTWIYDFGREAFVYCGNINAESLSSAQKAGAGETAGQ